MGRRGTPRMEENVSPNLIPMIDIMFLMLLFFMLGADMGQRDIEDVALPLAMNVKEDKKAEGKTKDRLTVNILHQLHSETDCVARLNGSACLNEKHWRIAVRGQDLTDPEKLNELLKEEADLRRGTGPDQKSSDRRVMVRADGGAPYGLVQDVMTACAQVGIYQVECGAARPVPDKPVPH
ncbi:MAG TPA: biopolymer transporter ExbD [Planctomycetota bacterium]|nr:biopolymer transporter ExbD [Planctomycetota bacterium]